MRAARQCCSPQPRLGSLQGWRSHSLSSRPVPGLSFLPAENCFPNIQLVATTPLFYHLALPTSPSSFQPPSKQLWRPQGHWAGPSAQLCVLLAPGHLGAGCLVLVFPLLFLENWMQNNGSNLKRKDSIFLFQQAPPSRSQYVVSVSPPWIWAHAWSAQPVLQLAVPDSSGNCVLSHYNWKLRCHWITKYPIHSEKEQCNTTEVQ